MGTNHGNDSLMVMYGYGNGTFQNAFTLAAGDRPGWVVMGDVNRDGNMDLLDTDYGDTTVSIHLGTQGTSVTIDQASPSATITAYSPALSNSSLANFNFTGSDPVFGGVLSGVNHLEYKLDGGNFTIATSPLALSNLSQGDHTFAIRAVDNAGNIGPSANYTWTVAPTDTIRPSLVSIVRSSAGIGEYQCGECYLPGHLQ